MSLCFNLVSFFEFNCGATEQVIRVNYSMPKIVDMITNETLVKKSMLHPIQILEALKTYDNGCGIKGNLTWNPIQKITDALDKAFYMSFPTQVVSICALPCSFK